MSAHKSGWTRGAVAGLVLSAVVLLFWIGTDQRRQIRERDLLSAAAQGNVGLMSELLDAVNVDVRLEGDGETALHRAASRGHLQATKLLLDRGATVDAADG